jgi:hypothetical protein
MARYFVHLPPNGSPAIFWRSSAAEKYAGEQFQVNLNLLAHAVGDDPRSLLRSLREDVIPPLPYDYGAGTVILQPFAATDRVGGDPERPRELSLGPRLRQFLDDPLDGDRMDLSLPFYDEEIKLGPTGGGWLRNQNDESAYHGATDFDTSPRAVFDVCAAADGKVLAKAGANGGAGAPIVLFHSTAGGKEFRTVYQHLDITSLPADIRKDADVRRGQFLGRTIGKPPADAGHVIHLHFGVAVKGPELTLNGVNVPALWYFIDPWGVYDHYEHDDSTNANYLPPESRLHVFRSTIAGATHTIQWRTQPLFKTLPVARSTDGYKEIVRVQVRARRGENFRGTLPDEHEQFVVWLRGDKDFFLVPLSQAKDRGAEFEMIALLREAFLRGKRVRLEYRYEGDLRYIMATWVQE